MEGESFRGDIQVQSNMHYWSIRSLSARSVLWAVRSISWVGFVESFAHRRVAFGDMEQGVALGRLQMIAWVVAGNSCLIARLRIYHLNPTARTYIKQSQTSSNRLAICISCCQRAARMWLLLTCMLEAGSDRRQETKISYLVFFPGSGWHMYMIQCNAMNKDWWAPGSKHNGYIHVHNVSKYRYNRI